MSGKLEGRVALVTGSGANIGEASAKALAEAGARVVVADINMSGAQRVAAEISALGGEAFAHPVDIAQEQSIVVLHRAVLQRYGRLDVLHNNAADLSFAQMGADRTVADMDAAIWDRALEVNARGTMLVIKHAIPALTQARGGSIINTSSSVTLLGDVLYPAYAASKGAINTLTRVAAAQLGRLNIRCNAILPGMIVTHHSRTLMTDEQLAMMQRHTLMPRLGAPDDVAGLVVFLASDAAGFITGQLIAVDGGLAAHQPWYGDVTAPPENRPSPPR
jgi:NAD(P)-dependent dehydrogenase (short-subunit alcohol dehydrogenase family)